MPVPERSRNKDGRWRKKRSDAGKPRKRYVRKMKPRLVKYDRFWGEDFLDKLGINSDEIMDIVSIEISRFKGHTLPGRQQVTIRTLVEIDPEKEDHWFLDKTHSPPVWHYMMPKSSEPKER